MGLLHSVLRHFPEWSRFIPSFSRLNDLQELKELLNPIAACYSISAARSATDFFMFQMGHIRVSDYRKYMRKIFLKILM